MTKIQVYLPDGAAKALRRLAKKRKRSVADLAREALERVWLREPAAGPVGLFHGLSRGSSTDHDWVFDQDE